MPDMVFFTIPVEPPGPADLNRYSWTAKDGFLIDPSGPWVKTFRRFRDGRKDDVITIYVLLDSPARWEEFA
jgi:hypothetical protein